MPETISELHKLYAEVQGKKNYIASLKSLRQYRQKLLHFIEADGGSFTREDALTVVNIVFNYFEWIQLNLINFTDTLTFRAKIKYFVSVLSEIIQLSRNKLKYIQLFTQPILDKLIYTTDEWFNTILTKVFISCLQHFSSAVRANLVKDTFYMNKIADLIISSEDYEYQVNLLDVLHRLNQQTTIKRKAKEWFADETMYCALVEISAEKFDRDVRYFLNAVNNHYMKVISIQATSAYLDRHCLKPPKDLSCHDEKLIWVDFNVKSISIQCSKKNVVASALDDEKFETLTVPTSSIEKINIKKIRKDNRKFFKIRCKLYGEVIPVVECDEKIKNAKELTITLGCSTKSQMIVNQLSKRYIDKYRDTNSMESVTNYPFSDIIPKTSEGVMYKQLNIDISRRRTSVSTISSVAMTSLRNALMPESPVGHVSTTSDVSFKQKTSESIRNNSSTTQYYTCTEDRHDSSNYRENLRMQYENERSNLIQDSLMDDDDIIQATNTSTKAMAHSNMRNILKEREQHLPKKISRSVQLPRTLSSNERAAENERTDNNFDASVVNSQGDTDTTINDIVIDISSDEIINPCNSVEELIKTPIGNGKKNDSNGFRKISVSVINLIDEEEIPREQNLTHLKNASANNGTRRVDLINQVQRASGRSARKKRSASNSSSVRKTSSHKPSYKEANSSEVEPVNNITMTKDIFLYENEEICSSVYQPEILSTPIINYEATVNRLFEGNVICEEERNIVQQNIVELEKGNHQVEEVLANIAEPTVDPKTREIINKESEVTVEEVNNNDAVLNEIGARVPEVEKASIEMTIADVVHEAETTTSSVNQLKNVDQQRMNDKCSGLSEGEASVEGIIEDIFWQSTQRLQLRNSQEWEKVGENYEDVAGQGVVGGTELIEDVVAAEDLDKGLEVQKQKPTRKRRGKRGRRPYAKKVKATAQKKTKETVHVKVTDGGVENNEEVEERSENLSDKLQANLEEGIVLEGEKEIQDNEIEPDEISKGFREENLTQRESQKPDELIHVPTLAGTGGSPAEFLESFGNIYEQDNDKNDEVDVEIDVVGDGENSHPAQALNQREEILESPKSMDLENSEERYIFLQERAVFNETRCNLITHETEQHFNNFSSNQDQEVQNGAWALLRVYEVEHNEEINSAAGNDRDLQAGVEDALVKENIQSPVSMDLENIEDTCGNRGRILERVVIEQLRVNENNLIENRNEEVQNIPELAESTDRGECNQDMQVHVENYLDSNDKQPDANYLSNVEPEDKRQEVDSTNALEAITLAHNLENQDEECRRPSPELLEALRLSPIDQNATNNQLSTDDNQPPGRKRRRRALNCCQDAGFRRVLRVKTKRVNYCEIDERGKTTNTNANGVKENLAENVAQKRKCDQNQTGELFQRKKNCTEDRLNMSDNVMVCDRTLDSSSSIRRRKLYNPNDLSYLLDESHPTTEIGEYIPKKAMQNLKNEFTKSSELFHKKKSSMEGKLNISDGGLSGKSVERRVVQTQSLQKSRSTELLQRTKSFPEKRLTASDYNLGIGFRPLELRSSSEIEKWNLFDPNDITYLNTTPLVEKVASDVLEQIENVAKAPTQPEEHVQKPKRRRGPKPKANKTEPSRKLLIQPTTPELEVIQESESEDDEPVSKITIEADVHVNPSGERLKPRTQMKIDNKPKLHKIEHNFDLIEVDSIQTNLKLRPVNMPKMPENKRPSPLSHKNIEKLAKKYAPTKNSTPVVRKEITKILSPQVENSLINKEVSFAARKREVSLLSPVAKRSAKKKDHRKRKHKSTAEKEFDELINSMIGDSTMSNVSSKKYLSPNRFGYRPKSKLVINESKSKRRRSSKNKSRNSGYQKYKALSESTPKEKKRIASSNDTSPSLPELEYEKQKPKVKPQSQSLTPLLKTFIENKKDTSLEKQQKRKSDNEESPPWVKKIKSENVLATTDYKSSLQNAAKKVTQLSADENIIEITDDTVVGIEREILNNISAAGISNLDDSIGNLPLNDTFCVSPISQNVQSFDGYEYLVRWLTADFSSQKLIEAFKQVTKNICNLNDTVQKVQTELEEIKKKQGTGNKFVITGYWGGIGEEVGGINNFLINAQNGTKQKRNPPATKRKPRGKRAQVKEMEAAIGNEKDEAIVRTENENRIESMDKLQESQKEL